MLQDYSKKFAVILFVDKPALLSVKVSVVHRLSHFSLWELGYIPLGSVLHDHRFCTVILRPR
jgi:hypothetical protein